MKLSKERQGALLLIGTIIIIYVISSVVMYWIDLLTSKLN